MRNPHRGCQVWELGKVWAEFKWDMAHPRELHRGVWDGMRGRNPDLTPEMRLAAFGMCVLGLGQMVLGVVALVFG